MMTKRKLIKSAGAGAALSAVGAAAGAACGESAAPLNRRHWRIKSKREAPFAATGKLRFA
jgi:hypothetical protein